MTETADLLLDQKRIGQLIQDLALAVDNPAGEAYNYHELLVRLEILDDYWSTFSQNDILIQRAAVDGSLNEKPYFKNHYFTVVSTSYISSKSWYKARMAALSISATQAVPSSGHTDVAPIRISTQASLELVKLPTFSGVQREITCSGLSGRTISVARARVRALITSPSTPEFRHEFSALVLGKVANDMPSKRISSDAWSHLHNVSLADPTFNVPGRIDAIFSSRVLSAVLQNRIMKGQSFQPSALETVFGWVVIGAEEPPENAKAVRSVLHVATNDDQLLADALAKFWEVESVPTSAKHSPEEEACLRHFHQTYSRNDEGRFVVRLPFRQEPELPGSKIIAESCLNRLFKRFNRQPEVAEAYRTFMTEYVALNHMEAVPNSQDDCQKHYFIPHHCVFKKDTGKIRVVFNASQPRSNGRSLNSYLAVGPNMQDDVLAIILRWLFLAMVVTCDVVKMFRQFLMHPDDRNWQRILWRESMDNPIQEFRLCTVTYGEACAGFQANACMLQLANDGEKSFPRASEAIRKKRYMDDFYLGEDSAEELKQTTDELLQLLSSAGMEVGKWASNCPEILRGIPQADALVGISVQQDQETVSTLGLRWNTAEDFFCFKISDLPTGTVVTKRTILAEVARLFDPIGFVSALAWDEPIPEKHRESWLAFRSQLPDLEKIKIHRWIGTFKRSAWELHGFCDASERAYSAVVYAAVRDEDGFSARLLTAKAKVAPIKVISIPKLELCGALLLSRLVSYVIANIELQPSQVHCWTDSRIVLAWLQGHPSRWKTFVANRVSEISSTVPSAVWRHVCSEENPADLASRGVTPRQLQTSSLWWRGPEWLKRPQAEWPNSSGQEFSTELERKKEEAKVMVTQSTEFLEWTTRFSSVEKLARTLAWIHRWRNNSKLHPEERRFKFLDASELRAGYCLLFKNIQRAYFTAEIKALKSNNNVSRSSSISRLGPFLDDKGVLRVGGRLQNAYLSFEEKHPIILHTKNHVTELLVSQAHLDTCHGGPILVQAHLSRRFWLIRGRNFIRRIVRQCVVCVRHEGSTMQQQMAPLPAVRLRPTRPFTVTGVDYAGPFLLKASPGRGRKVFKSYVAIFVCMIVRAVHIEVVSDLTSPAFLAAYRRFVARRGYPSIMFSDNGTTFKGADTALKNLHAETSQFSEEVAASIAKDKVQWTFIPPRAPNFGGLWETNVRSIKRHLYRVIGESKLTFEEFSTIAASIEACLNSRPLSAQSGEAGDLSALTPGHFLIGGEIVAPPEPFMETNEKPTACSRWHLLTLMNNHFWKRWRRECLHQLQQRSKWLYPNYKMAVGDLVLYKDNLLPPTKWPLGRIVHLYTGPDGLSRVARIKTAVKEYTRPVNKLVRLPVNGDARIHLATVREATAGGEVPECYDPGVQQ